MALQNAVRSLTFMTVWREPYFKLSPICCYINAGERSASVSAFSFASNLTLKAPNKIAADNILIFYFYLSKKIKLDFSCEPSAWQRIHLKHQVLFSLKNIEKIFMNVVCCGCDWRFKG